MRRMRTQKKEDKPTMKIYIVRRKISNENRTIAVFDQRTETENKIEAYKFKETLQLLYPDENYEVYEYTRKETKK